MFTLPTYAEKYVGKVVELTDCCQPNRKARR